MSKGQSLALTAIKSIGELSESYEKALKKIEDLLIEASFKDKTINENKERENVCLKEIATQSDTIKAYETSKKLLMNQNKRLLKKL